MRTRARTLAAVAWAIAICGTSAVAIQPKEFKKHVIDGDFAGGYQVSVADIDKDGKPDVIALSTTPSQLVWYKNPEWGRHTITQVTKNNIDVAPADVDGDGDIDLAVAYDFNIDDSTHGGNVAWLECPANPAKSEDWAMHPIGAVPTAHRLRWANVDLGAGLHKYLVVLPIVGVGAKAPLYEGGVQFTAFGPGISDPWKSTVIDSSLEIAHGMRVCQWDDDPSDEILTASQRGIHLFDVDPATHTLAKRLLGKGHDGTRPQQGSSEIVLGKLRSQAMRFVATIEPWHGNEVVIYEIGAPTTMGEARVVLDSSLKDGHALGVIDIEGDGNDEIVAGCRGGDQALRVYQFEPETAKWAPTLIDKDNVAAAGIHISDINRDGRDDIVAVGSATHNVAWYENRPKH